MKPYNEEQTKKEQVEQMFDNIAPTYDKLNHIMSLNIDRMWRRRGNLFGIISKRVTIHCSPQKAKTSSTLQICTSIWGLPRRFSVQGECKSKYRVAQSLNSVTTTSS